jgi:hypothetical protein
MAQYLRWRVRGIYQLNDFGRQFEQAELLHLVCHGERHAALVLLCGHVGLDGDAVATFFPSSRCFVCGVADLRLGLSPRRDHDGHTEMRSSAASCKLQAARASELTAAAKNTRQPGFPCTLTLHTSHVKEVGLRIPRLAVAV